MKPTTMTPEVADMIALRHGAEQRGNFSPLGRLLFLITDHGKIEFPAEDGEWTGPDLALACTDGEVLYVDKPASSQTTDVLMVLGAWTGLPALRKLSDDPCPKCRHACDICDGSGKKQCQGYQCGGRGWIPGPWLECPGPGCNKETGAFKPGCATCGGTGQIPKQLPCPMCEGTKVMTCPRCKGSGIFSTGKLGGQLDYKLPPCKACKGFGFRFDMVPQDLDQFVNAKLKRRDGIRSVRRARREICWLVLGPIREFVIQDCRDGQRRAFDIGADAAGDLMVMLVPRSPRTKPQKAYLVGGVVREREREAVSA
jgi:hypothetical protein